jgi:general secretion pathway protein C
MIRKGIVTTNIVLLIALGMLGIKTFQKLMDLKSSRQPIEMPVEKPPSEPSETASKPIVFYAPIFKRNLFNTQNAPEKTEPAIDIDALQETRLKLELLGTVATQDAGAYAVIKDPKTGKQKLYRVGDTIQDATIKRICRETVVLNHNGEDSVLKMERKDSAAGVTQISTPFDELEEPTENPRRQKRVLSRELLDNAMRDSADLMNQFTLNPHEVDGQVEGVTIGRIKRNSIVMRMGLRNGDVISAVNGTPVDSIENTVEFMSSLMENSAVSIDILRRGKPVRIEYSIQ